MSAGWRIANKFYNQHRSKFLGSGCFSLVFAKNNTTVIKIGLSTIDPYLDYIELAEKNPNNPWFPKIFKKYIDYDHDFYVIELERLEEVKEIDNKIVEKIIANETSGIVDYTLIDFIIKINTLVVSAEEEDLSDGTITWDLGHFNFMRRPGTKELVATDPLNIATTYEFKEW